MFKGKSKEERITTLESSEKYLRYRLDNQDFRTNELVKRLDFQEELIGLLLKELNLKVLHIEKHNELRKK